MKEPTRYKSVRIREKTYKELKMLAVKLDISVLELIQRLYDSRNIQAGSKLTNEA